MVRAVCPVSGCKRRSDRWRKSYLLSPLLRAVAVPLKAPTAAVCDNVRMCRRCWQHYYKCTKAATAVIVASLSQANDNAEEDAQPVTPPPSPLPRSAVREPLHHATPLVIGLTAHPFTSHPTVLHDLYSSASLQLQHRGLSFWLLSASDFPLTTARTSQPPDFNSVQHTQSTNYFMPAIPFNLPERGGHLHITGSVMESYEPPDDQQLLLDVLDLVREPHNTRQAEPTYIMYQKDNEEFTAWLQQPQKEQKKRPLPSLTIHSPLNPHLFCLDPSNLCCLMSDYSFAGFLSPSWYRKTPGSFFCLHVEQLFAPFYNLCYEGGTTWWVVQREDRQRLDEYVVRQAKRWYDVTLADNNDDDDDDDSNGQLSNTEREAVAGLLYTKQLLFHPDDLRRAGVRLTEVKQTPGTVVVGDGDLVHFGVCTVLNNNKQSMQSSVNEAVNFIPVQWLTTGLPRLTSWLRWLQRAWLPLQHPDAMCQPSLQALRLAVQDARTNELIAHHCSPLWCNELLNRLHDLIVVPQQSSSRSSCSHRATRLCIDRLLGNDEPVRAEVVENIDEALRIMNNGVVKKWLLNNSVLNGSRLTEKNKQYLSEKRRERQKRKRELSQ